VTEDGIEIHFGVNHIGHFLFANALLPAVLECPSDGRVVIVSSETHRGSPSAPSVLDLDDLFVEGIFFCGFIRYA
jgi:NAD(P)-dependent dehydrogenase (short-subunit alcohol dehydrogenase family)